MKTNIFRDIEISTLVLQGVSQKEVGERFEISASRVHQIVYRTLRRTMNPKLGLIKPISDYYPISEARKHKHIWIDRLDVLRRFKRSEMNNTSKNLGFITGDRNDRKNNQLL